MKPDFSKIKYDEMTLYGTRKEMVLGINKIQNQNKEKIPFLKEGMFGFDEYVELLSIFDNPIYYIEDLISALKQKDYEFRLYWKNKEPWLSKNINYTGPQLSGKIMQNHDKYNFNILIDSYCKYVIDYRKNNNVIIYEPEILYKGMEISKWVNYLYPKIFGPINIELYPEFSSAFCVIVYKFLIFERKNKNKESIDDSLQNIWTNEYNKELIKLLRSGSNKLPNIPEKFNLDITDKLIKHVNFKIIELENNLNIEIEKMKLRHESELSKLKERLNE